MGYSDKPREAIQLGIRLHNERKIAGLNQTECAKIGGINRRTQVAYEQGNSLPDALYLLRLHQFKGSGHRIDIFYVVTGERAKPVK